MSATKSGTLRAVATRLDHALQQADCVCDPTNDFDKLVMEAAHDLLKLRDRFQQLANQSDE